MWTARRLGVAVVLATALTGCTGGSGDDARVVQLGAPGESNRELTPEEIDALSAPAHTDADVTFVQDMIPHHRQALVMTALVAQRSERDDMRALAKRMDVSQTDEIVQLESWLTDRGEEVPGPHVQHGDGHTELMPGMLNDAELGELRAATGARFDSLFLQYMIRHHEGAVIMVERLLTEGFGGQEPQVFQLAQHIDADQRVEISRMKSMLAARAADGAASGDGAGRVETFPGKQARTVGGAIKAMFAAYDRGDLARWLGAWTDAGFRQAYGIDKEEAALAAPGWTPGRAFGDGTLDVLEVVEHGEHAPVEGHETGASEHGLGEHAVVQTREAGQVTRYRLDLERERNRWRVAGRTPLAAP